ncbi:MAG TPA: hypothetical protein VJO34_01355 [Methylomirabilota bacterium]|nr:hypothetical protein [Methylomirabilota bacterium]
MRLVQSNRNPSFAAGFATATGLRLDTPRAPVTRWKRNPED